MGAPAATTPAGPPLFGQVYADQYGSIQNAITAAGTNGAVIIPPTYTGTDSYANPLGLCIIDMRPGKLALNAATGAAKAAVVTCSFFPFSQISTPGPAGSSLGFSAGQPVIPGSLPATFNGPLSG